MKFQSIYESLLDCVSGRAEHVTNYFCYIFSERGGQMFVFIHFIYQIVSSLG